MDPRQLTAKELSGILIQILCQCRGHLHEHQQAALTEAARRVLQHELFVQDVLPDLRARMDQVEEAARIARDGGEGTR